MFRIRLCLLFAALLLPTASYGQSALDGFDPQANGPIRVVAVQPDGKILIGGGFTALSPNGGPTFTRNHIARLNPDGTVDSAFNPDANDVVRAIALQADGKILIGGQFNGPNSVGGQTRNRVARLDPVTGAPDSFDPNADNIVFAITLEADGKILVGGDFANIGGQPRNHIARLDPNTGFAESFDANANSRILTIVLQPDGRILVGGEFTAVGGQTRNRIARLDPVAGVADSFDPNASNAVYGIAIQADGKILAGGFFNGANSIGGQARNHIARLDATTGLADAFDPNADARVISIAVQPDGKILAGGDFLNIGGQTRYRTARLDPETGLADSVDQSLSNRVYSIAVQSDGKIIVGGDVGIVRLEIDGRRDQTLGDLSPSMPDHGPNVNAIALQPDGKILIGGGFGTVLDVARRGIARLNTDGTLDNVFDPQANGPVYSIAVQADGNILVGGGFQNIGGQPRLHIARLDAVTGLADSFNPSTDGGGGSNGEVLTIAVQADGKILIGGAFTQLGFPFPVTQRNYIARLNSATGLADSFNPNASGRVFTINVQPDGMILVGGIFSSIGGQIRNGIARLDPVTGLANSFDAHVDGSIIAMALQSNGKILVTGGFLSAGGQTRNHMARLDGTTGLADSFDSVFNDYALSVAMQADGKVMAGGYFTYISNYVRNYVVRVDGTNGVPDAFDPNANNWAWGIAPQSDGKLLVGIQGGSPPGGSVGGQSRNMFARLSNDAAALQNLAVTRTKITWTRSGSSPQLARTTFEYSTDRVHYNLLGTGLAAGVDWQLSGLNLSTEQNIYVRARGYYRTGYLNGSESITESVRNAFLHEVQSTSVVSRRNHAGTPFDITLPIDGSGIECRGTGDGNYQIIASFANTLASVGGAAVTSGAGAIASHMMDADAHKYIVNLSGVTDAQSLTVTLTNVDDSVGSSSASIPISFRVLQGDTNGDGSVNSADIAQTKSKSGQTVDATNFRNDVNADGALNSGDISLVKSKSGTGLSSPSSLNAVNR